MRTTLTIDDDLYEAVKSMAKASDEDLGEVVSNLLRNALNPNRPVPPEQTDPSFPFVTYPATGNVINSDNVREFLEEEGP
jgi:hypothetical protein